MKKKGMKVKRKMNAENVRKLVLQVNFGYNVTIAKNGNMQHAQQCKKELRDNN